jgi:hypothetical protein
VFYCIYFVIALSLVFIIVNWIIGSNEPVKIGSKYRNTLVQDTSGAYKIRDFNDKFVIQRNLKDYLVKPATSTGVLERTGEPIFYWLILQDGHYLELANFESITEDMLGKTVEVKGKIDYYNFYGGTFPRLEADSISVIDNFQPEEIKEPFYLKINRWILFFVQAVLPLLFILICFILIRYLNISKKVEAAIKIFGLIIAVFSWWVLFNLTGWGLFGALFAASLTIVLYEDIYYLIILIFGLDLNKYVLYYKRKP